MPYIILNYANPKGFKEIVDTEKLGFGVYNFRYAILNLGLSLLSSLNYAMITRPIPPPVPLPTN